MRIFNKLIIAFLVCIIMLVAFASYKVIFPLKHAMEQFRLEKKNKEMQADILRMANEHRELVEQLLSDSETKDRAQKRISEIVEKWKK
jgi:flagellar biosynthesis/type III secretory pathway M-ring protein FliF/YscJ